MKYRVLLGLLGLTIPFPTMADPEDLVCRSTGMAGIAFGQLINERLAEIDEGVSSGVDYYSMRPAVEIQPFARLIVGVTPASRRVFSIRLEMHGTSAELDKLINEIKTVLTGAHTNLVWQVVGNHHYATHLDDLDLVIYRIGDIVDGKATHALSYDCDSRSNRKKFSTKCANKRDRIEQEKGDRFVARRDVFAGDQRFFFCRYYGCTPVARNENSISSGSS